MRHRKRLPPAPHPRSVFARGLRVPAANEVPHVPEPRRNSLARSKHRVRAARMRIGSDDVVVVEVKAALVADVFEAQLAITAIELTCAKPVVLWAYEPCGCRELFGRREHISVINEMPSEEIEWEHIEIDFARPVLPMTPLN